MSCLGPIEESDARFRSYVESAPIAIMVFDKDGRCTEEYGPRGEQLYCMQDACAAVCNAMLAAVELGLGTCWVDAVDEDLAGKAVDLAAGQRAAIILPLGYPAEQPPRTPRRALSDLVTDL